MKLVYLFKSYLKNADNKIMTVFKHVILICLFCGLIVGIKNVLEANKVINSIKSIVSNEDFKFEIKDNKLDFYGKEELDYIGKAQIFISDKDILADANDIKQEKISNKDYIIMLKDGIQCSAGIVGMNSYLDSQKQYNEFFKDEKVDNNVFLNKLSKVQIALDIVIVLVSLIFNICEFIVYVSFIAIVMYLVSRVFKHKCSFEKILKMTIYVSFIFKIIITILQAININYNYPQIMLLTFLTFPCVIIPNRK